MDLRTLEAGWSERSADGTLSKTQLRIRTSRTFGDEEGGEKSSRDGTRYHDRQGV